MTYLWWSPRVTYVEKVKGWLNNDNARSLWTNERWGDTLNHMNLTCQQRMFTADKEMPIKQSVLICPLKIWACNITCYNRRLHKSWNTRGSLTFMYFFTMILCGTNFCDNVWCSYSHVSFKWILRACIPTLKAVRCETANLLTFVLCQVCKGSW